ncbi:uncharacterized protein LOC143960202 isoform X2 [Lithobates pipiens]
MMDRCSREPLTIAFLLLSAAFPLICGQTVRGIEGRSITLPCFYNVKRASDITSMCWGRGSCPSSKCNEVLIWTDGYKVTHQSSDRYQLNDNIARGQISLTISQASLSDAGTYCCRIEHHGWFNDEKKNIRLDMEKAPPTTPPTTTRRTTPQRTRPPVRKTTQPPKTTKAITPAVTSVKATTLLPITEIVSTPPPTPARTTIAVPTGGETMEITTEPFVTCELSEEMIHQHEAFDHHNANSIENGNSDLFSGNMETMEKKESSLSLHMIITAVCISLIVLVVVSLLILKFRGKERGRYLFGFDPNLELVVNAEAPLSETDAGISQTVTSEVDKVEADKFTL